MVFSRKKFFILLFLAVLVVVAADTELGRINIESNPEGAFIFVDSYANQKGKTPKTIETKIGEHTLILKKNGYETYKEKIQVDESTTITINLTPIEGLTQEINEKEVPAFYKSMNPDEGKEEVVPQSPPKVVEINQVNHLQDGPVNEYSKKIVDEIKNNPEKKSKATEKLLDKISRKKQDETIRVWIYLKTNESEKNKKQKDYRPNQEKFIEKTKIQGFKPRFKFKDKNTFSADVTWEALNQLIQTDEVEIIDAVDFYFPSLTESVPQINATGVWTIEENGRTITGFGQSVCILDSGINYSHANFGGCTRNEFLAGNCAKVPYGYDYDNETHGEDPDPMDTSDSDVVGYGHGTHVSGIVASDDATYSGVAPDTKIISMRVCGVYYDGYYFVACPDDAITAAIVDCTTLKDTYNISVITMSLGGGEYCDVSTCEAAMSVSYSPEVTAIENAYAAGIFIDASSGNDGSTTGISAPSCHGDIVSVGMVYDNTFSWANWGSCIDYSTQPDNITCASNRCSILDMYAPGCETRSTSVSGGFTNKSGTSMAAPHVAGAAALLQQYAWEMNDSALTPSQIKEALIATGVGVTRDGLTKPRIDIAAALEYFNFSTPATPPYFGNVHSVHSDFSDGAVDQGERYQQLIANFTWAASVDHDYSLTASEWSQLRTGVNGNNTDGEFTYMVGYEWKSTQGYTKEACPFFIDDGPSSFVAGSNVSYDTFGELATWLNSNNGIACFNHPARESKAYDWTDSELDDELLPCVEILNKGVYHWNGTWVCAQNSGCTSYTNPSPVSPANWNGSVYNALENGLHLGFVGGWDYHGALGGDSTAYTGIAESIEYLNRTEVFNAIKNRHTWAAEDQIIMNVTANNGSTDFIMGDRFYSNSDTLDITYNITAVEGETIGNVSFFLNGIIVNMTRGGSQNINGTYNVNLDPGENYIFIEALQSNGNRSWSSPMYITPPNNAPTLTSISMSPSMDVNGSTFSYQVTYTDSDNDAPTYVRVNIDGVDNDMSESSGSYDTGAVFDYNQVINSYGTHQYYFTTSDGNATTTSSTYIGPYVISNSDCTVTSPPINNDDWNIASSETCSNSAFVGSSTGDLNIGDGNTLTLSQTTVYMNGTQVVFQGTSVIELDDSVISFI